MKTLHEHFFTVLVATIIVLGVGTIAAIWYLKPAPKNASVNSYETCVSAGNPVMESFPEQCSVNGKTYTNTKASQTQATETITSANEGFSVQIPKGWGPFLNASDGDYLLLMGEKQPSGDMTKSVSAPKTDAYGSDGPVLFSIRLGDKSGTEGVPQGTPKGVTIGKAEDALSGMRYTTEYAQDTEVGIGIPRIAGDRDYYYVFDVGNSKVLTVTYSVYASDPRNLITTVDNIVQSIRVKR